jgi:hypothetical protein
MDRVTARWIIAEEDLKDGVFFSAPDNAVDAVVIEETSDGYRVYNTDARAAVDENSITIFSEESSALTEFVERLRAWNEYLRLRNTNS